ncbi:MAG: response regulator [Nitrospinae bacterium]|nr:response regulator [Nitrospinota bacterium]
MSESKSRIKLLLVEDSLEDRVIYKRLLEQCPDLQCEVLESDSGEDGLRMCRENAPDCILLDYYLPDIDGLEFITDLREIQYSGAIVMLTGMGNEAIAVNAIKEGAQDYLVKDNLTSPSLGKAIQSALRMKELDREKKRAEEELKAHKDQLEEQVEKRTAELRTAHQQLLHAEKLSATGKLAASIAHEFNNPIYGIRNVLEQLREDLALDETHAHLADLAIRECSRIATLIRKLQDFHRPTDGVVSLMDVHQAIDDMLLLTDKKMKERNVRLKKNYAPRLPQVRAVADQIKQVILNLVQNAEEAIPDPGGEIVITTQAQADAVRIEIQDTGSGIDPETMKHIFDPFFTTKPQVKGTGLGLSVSYGIIKKHGGDLLAESIPGKGSTFTVVLPCIGEGK